uniref:CDC42 effector protein (Rho GTPase binding) 1a n=1 Tax=Gadus morhua TaxID=8049 RepID=A0A8C5AK85_GADMO
MNLQGKLSGLKGLVSGAHGRRRFKGDLTTDMISPPMDDFRHTMHVGRGGDVFGDTSFLSNHGGSRNREADANTTCSSTPTSPTSTPDNKIGAFFSRTLRQVRKGSASEGRPSGGGGGGGGGESKDVSSPPPPAVSPIIKNAISLPRLDAVGTTNGGGPVVRELFPPQEAGKASYGLESGFVTLPRLSRSERPLPSVPTSCSPDLPRTCLDDAVDSVPSDGPAYAVTMVPLSLEPVTMTTHSDSLRSLTSLDTFTLDLGPSLMSEVFGMIDSPGGHSDGHFHAWEAEEAGSAFGMTNEGSEMDSATISYVDSLLREDCGSRKSPYGGDWEEEEERMVMMMMEANGGAGHPLKGAVPDVVLVGPTAEDGRARPGVGMETDSFQKAADVLARHYRVAGSKLRILESESLSQSKSLSYGEVDEEEEIKV